VTAAVSSILAGRSIAALSFRVSHQLYAALQPRLGRIREAVVHPDEEDLPELIQLISQKCLQQLEFPKHHEPQTFLEEARRALAEIIRKLRVQQKNPLVIPILEEVESEFVQPLAPEACLETMQDLCAQGWTLLGKLIECWGGPLARARLRECQPATPAFAINNRLDRPDLTYPSTHRERNEIIWTLGHRPPPIEAFLGYVFYFLHEYLSHLFHTWDGVDPTLAETHLLRAALLFLETRPDLAEPPSLLDAMFLARDFDALRIPEPRYLRIEKNFKELLDYAGTPLLTFLLEWAAQSADTARTNQVEYKLVLNGLYGLKHRETAQALLWGAERLASGWNPELADFSKTYGRVHAYAVQYEEQTAERLNLLASQR
jgi:hypothetical protein